MLVNFIVNKEKVQMGEEIEVQINGETKKFILGPAKTKWNGEVGYINAPEYLLQDGRTQSKKLIPLGRDYGVKCACNGKYAFPLLRNSFGREKNYFKTWKSDNYIWEKPKLVGIDCNLWPIIEKLEEIK